MKHNLQIKQGVVLVTFGFICIAATYSYFKYFKLTSSVHNSRRITATEDFRNSLVIPNEAHVPRIVNKILTEYRLDLSTKFQSAVDRNLTASHPDVINLIQDMMDPPSDHMMKMSLPLRHTAQSNAILPYLQEKDMLHGGFFIECGALDGERSSNTIFLEKRYGWAGLLIEADPYFYTQLIGKNRKAWSINACLSPSNQIQWLDFKEASRGTGQLSIESQATRKVPCFPFESYMLALGRDTVDFFSLDIEGFEIPVIKSINYTKFTIKTWTIEYPIDGDIKLVDLMTSPSMGYKVLTKAIDNTMFYARDVLFVKDSA